MWIIITYARRRVRTWHQTPTGWLRALSCCRGWWPCPSTGPARAAVPLWRRRAALRRSPCRHWALAAVSLSTSPGESRWACRGTGTCGLWCRCSGRTCSPVSRTDPSRPDRRASAGRSWSWGRRSPLGLPRCWLQSCTSRQRSRQLSPACPQFPIN